METADRLIHRAQAFYTFLMAKNINKLLDMLTINFQSSSSTENQNIFLHKKEFEEKLKALFLQNIEIEHLNEPSYIYQEDGTVLIKSNSLQKWECTKSDVVNLYDFEIELMIHFNSDKLPKISRMTLAYCQMHLGHELSQANVMARSH